MSIKSQCGNETGHSSVLLVDGNTQDTGTGSTHLPSTSPFLAGTAGLHPLSSAAAEPSMRYGRALRKKIEKV